MGWDAGGRILPGSSAAGPAVDPMDGRCDTRRAIRTADRRRSRDHATPGGQHVRRLPGRRRPCPGRDGRRLPRHRAAAAPAHRPQADRAGPGRRPRVPRALPARSRRPRGPRAPERGPDPRGGRVGGPALPRDALPRRPGPRGGRPHPRAAAACGGARPHRPDRGCAGRGARAGHRPPRRDAVEHPAGRARDPVPDRLRPHEARGNGRPSRPDAGTDGDAGLHGARAVLGGCRGTGSRPGPRAASRRLRPRLRAGDAPHRLPALPPGHVRGRAVGPRPRRPAEHRRAGARPSAGDRPGDRAGPGQGPRPALRIARGADRRRARRAGAGRRASPPRLPRPPR